MKYFTYLFLSLSLLLSSCLVLAKDRPAIHGMLMVGSKTVFLSHLPMFHSPHDYQVIVQVSLSSTSGSPQEAYVNDRLKTHEKIYTLVPDQPFVLPDIMQSHGSFAATIYRGHFERGGVPILKNVTVTIQKTIYFHQFDSNEQTLPQLQYIAFGDGEEQFLAHRISKCPDYDQVIQVDTVLPSGFFITFPGKDNAAFLKEGDSADALVGVSHGTHRSDSVITVMEQFYLETGDLVCMDGE